MAKNLKKIIIGIVLILSAALCALFAFYFLEVKPELASRQQALNKKLDAQEEKLEKRVEEIKRSEQKGVVSGDKVDSLDSPLEPKTSSTVANTSSQPYSNEEITRKEGALWFDRKTSKLMATLGSVHGLQPGNYLTVFEGEKKVGQVKVEKVLDVISYVVPLEGSTDSFRNPYYRIILE